jgi:drug/metabolite transporter (DMT)-like permease
MNFDVIFLALLGAVFFALGLVLAEAGLRHLGPLRGACVSIPTALIMFAALSPWTVDWAQWSNKGAVLFALVGCLYPATVTLLNFTANRRIGPNLSGALSNLTPLFAVVFAMVALGEAPGAGKFAAVIIIVAGVYLLYRAPVGSLVHVAPWIFALPLVGAVIRGGVQPLAKIGLADWPSAFAAGLIGYAASAAVVLTTGAIRNRRLPVYFTHKGWQWFAGAGASNGLALVCLYGALALGEVTLVAPLYACYPLATLAFSRLFPGPVPITRPMVIGIAITVAGVALLLSV